MAVTARKEGTLVLKASCTYFTLTLDSPTRLRRFIEGLCVVVCFKYSWAVLRDSDPYGAKLSFKLIPVFPFVESVPIPHTQTAGKHCNPNKALFLIHIRTEPHNRRPPGSGSGWTDADPDPRGEKLRSKSENCRYV